MDWNRYDETGREIILELKDGKGCSKKFWEDDYNFYEGEYLNGERHGKGKDTVKYGSITFEGEYVNGKRWTGKAYDKKGNIYFELKDGKGIKKQIYLSLIDIAQFEYEYFNGEKNGRGRGYIMKEVDKTNSEFDCRFEEKKLIKEKLIFEGEYKNNKLNGKVKEYIYNYKGNLKSEIEYLNGEKIKGKEYDNHGNMIFEGEYLYGCKLKGKEYIYGRLEYEGEYLNDKKWKGKGYDKNGNIIYELINGNGKVREYTSYGSLIFEGEYLNGMKHGKGKEYKSGEIVFEGEYINGKRKENSYFCFIY